MKKVVQRGADCVRAAAGRTGTPVVDVCRQIGVSEATSYLEEEVRGS